MQLQSRETCPYSGLLQIPDNATIVLAGFIARLNAVGYIVMQWEGS